MARKPNPDEAEPPFTDVSGDESTDAPIQIVDIDEIVSQTPSAIQDGKRFWIGSAGVLKFQDGTHYHVRSRHVIATDPKLIENLNEASKNPANYIFPEE